MNNRFKVSVLVATQKIQQGQTQLYASG